MSETMLRRGLWRGLDVRRLRFALVGFFLALALPSAALVYKAYGQLKWEAFHRQRTAAEELTDQIGGRLAELINAEEGRGFADYAFLTVAGDPAANFLQRSPLSAYPVRAELPGLIGYFQVSPEGALSTPLLPPAWLDPLAIGIPPGEYRQREALTKEIGRILTAGRLLRDPGMPETGPGSTEARMESAPSADETVQRSASRAMAEESAAPLGTGSAQAAFDALRQGRAASVPRPRELDDAEGGDRPERLEDFELDSRLEAKSRAREDSLVPLAEKVSGEPERRALRKEQSALPATAASVHGASADRPASLAAPPGVRVSVFESEIDRFEFARLGSGYLVMFRNAWRDGQRYVQGALLDQGRFMDGMLRNPFSDSSLAQSSRLVVAWQGEVLEVLSGGPGRAYFTSRDDLTGTLLYRGRLAAPMDALELLFSVKHLPAGPGAPLIGWLAALLAVLLAGGCYALYRLGAGQIRLARQQQDFVSAVSHELRTPITSIRMYGEMLKAGWADEAKKRSYYEYIHDESERLSRLIDNVLQLARLSRNGLELDLKPVAAGRLLAGVHRRIASQIERAGFSLRLDPGEASACTVRVDNDCFTQIVINLVDNAIKFAAKAENKTIDLTARRESDGSVAISVRDYGPGIAKDQMKKIFLLFYRTENELMRETAGTGIGLALVRELAGAMHGRVDVRNRDPGAAFSVVLPCADTGRSNG